MTLSLSSPNLVEESHTPLAGTNDLPNVFLYSWISHHYLSIVINDMRVTQRVTRNMLWDYRLGITVLKEIKYELVFRDKVVSGLMGALVLDKTSRVMRDIVSSW